jgi:Kef-type K+ transport system membrane component KefB
MSFATLAVICAVGLAGPLLAAPTRWHLPVVLGELMAGLVLGNTGVRFLHPGETVFLTLADIGFALVMFVAGSHVPVRDASLRTALRPGLGRAVGVGVLAIGVAAAISAVFGTGHVPLYAVLMASSSAALVLPIVDSLRLGGRPVLQLLPQVAIADAACIVALPLVIDPGHAARAALGALAVILSATVVYLVFNWLERTGLRHRVHRFSERRRFAVELRVSLTVLFGLAAVATRTHVSIMLAGFATGLAVAGVGPPRRLTRQLFAVTEGFLGPLFFVWLGASLNLRELGREPRFILVGIALGLGASACHLAMRAARQPISVAMLAGAQLGVPVAAATIGTQLRLLAPGEAAALLLGALVTIGVAVLGAGMAARSGLTADVATGGPTRASPSAGQPGTVAE